MEKLRAIEDLWFKVCITVVIVLLAAASLFFFGITNEMVIAVAVSWLALVAIWWKHGEDAEDPKNIGGNGR